MIDDLPIKRSKGPGGRTAIRSLAATALIVTACLGPTASQAQTNCRTVPYAEAPEALQAAFAQRMTDTSAGTWRRYGRVAKAGEPDKGVMYVATGTEVRFVVQETDRLTGEISVMVGGEPTDADFARLQVGANFLFSRVAGLPEEANRARVYTLLERTRSRRQAGADRVSDAIIVAQPLAAQAVLVSIGRRVCG